MCLSSASTKALFRRLWQASLPQANTQAEDAAQITTENCRACLWSVCRRKITAFSAPIKKHFLVVTRASVSDQLKKTRPDFGVARSRKALEILIFCNVDKFSDTPITAVLIPKSAASGIGFQKAKIDTTF